MTEPVTDNAPPGTPPQSASVIIPVLNGQATIGNTLRAITTQAGAPSDTQVIVVDNGSKDETMSIVRRFAVTLLEQPTPGPSAARNLGLHHARGEIVVCLDADTLPTRRWLAEMVAPFTDPAVVLVAGRTLAFKPQTPAERYVDARDMYGPQNTVHNPTFPFVTGMNMAVRRDAALKIGGWAEDMLSGEDVDLSLRIRQTFPDPIFYNDKAVLFHCNRTSDDGLRRQAQVYGRGSALMYLRHPEAVRWSLYRTWRVARQLVVVSGLLWSARAGRLLRLGSADRVEFLRYHRFWLWWFWRGFFTTYLRPGREQA